jgi:hypothetical protein
MRFDSKSDMVTLRLDVDELSPLMLRVANAMINNETIHTHAMYWISTHKYDAYKMMMDNVGVNAVDITISRQHAEKLLLELAGVLQNKPSDTEVNKIARICVTCHKGYISDQKCEAENIHECVVNR